MCIKIHGRFTWAEDFHWFSFRSPLHEDSRSQKAPKNTHFAHLVGSTCSKVLKIQQCTEIQYGNPFAICKLVTILYILYGRQGTHLIPKHCLLVISSRQGKIWVANPESKESFLTIPIPSKEGKSWSGLILRKSFEPVEMNSEDMPLWAMTTALFSKQCTNCCHRLASALQ